MVRDGQCSLRRLGVLALFTGALLVTAVALPEVGAAKSRATKRPPVFKLPVPDPANITFADLEVRIEAKRGVRFRKRAKLKVKNASKLADTVRVVGGVTRVAGKSAGSSSSATYRALVAVVNSKSSAAMAGFQTAGGGGQATSVLVVLSGYLDSKRDRGQHDGGSRHTGISRFDQTYRTLKNVYPDTWDKLTGTDREDANTICNGTSKTPSAQSVQKGLGPIKWLAGDAVAGASGGMWLTQSLNATCDLPMLDSFLLTIGATPSTPTQGDFALAIFPWYQHLSGFSNVCFGLSTDPAQPGAAMSANVTGPGLGNGVARSGALGAAGTTTVVVEVTQYGDYGIAATVTRSDGVTKTTTQTINVNEVPGLRSCP